MVDPRLRKRIRGRKVDGRIHWNSWKDMNHPGHQFKMRTRQDKMIPQGYRHDNLQTIPKDHHSYKPMQDLMEEGMLKDIRKEAPGPRKDFLIKDYELWVQNGRSTYGEWDPNNKVQKGIQELKNEVRRTRHNSTPIVDDFSEQDWKDKRMKRLLKRGVGYID